MVLALDDLVKLLAQFGLLDAAERGHGEAMLRRTLLGRATGCGAITPLGADGVRSVPGSRQLSSAHHL